MEKINVKKTDLINAPLWYHKRNLLQTATGYGHKLRTEYMIEYAGRKRRIYCSIFSNIGTCYIIVNKKKIIVDIEY